MARNAAVSKFVNCGLLRPLSVPEDADRICHQVCTIQFVEGYGTT